MARYKTNVQNLMVLLYTSNKSVNVITDTIFHSKKKKIAIGYVTNIGFYENYEIYQKASNKT